MGLLFKCIKTVVQAKRLKLFPAYPPPPRKHPESHQNDGNTGSRAKTSPCLRATRGTKRAYVTGNLPIPHPKHNCRNRALQHNVQANFRVLEVLTAHQGHQELWNRSPFPPCAKRQRGSRGWASMYGG